MRASLLLAALLVLAACGTDTPTDAGPSAATDTEEAPEGAGVSPFAGLSAPEQPAAPGGSLGTFTLTYLHGSGDDADTLAMEGFLPAALPASAMGSAPLDAVPNYKVAVRPSSVPDGFDLDPVAYLYATVDEVGEVEAEVQSGSNIFTESHDGLFRGTAYAITFPPLWNESATLSPELWVRDADKEDVTLASVPLPIVATPTWAQPLALPALPEDTSVRVRLDVRASEDGLVPILVYPRSFGRLNWGADAGEVDEFAQRRYEREEIKDAGTPYRFFLPNHEETQTQGYLLLFRP